MVAPNVKGCWRVRRVADLAPAVLAAMAHARAIAASGRPVLVNAWLDRSAFREGAISM